MSIIETIARLRIAVAHLGELKGWWSTSFYSDYSVGLLEYAFPRNKQVAFTASFDAVRSLLDEKIGSHNFHLFRLNVVLEEKIHRYTANLDFELSTENDELKVLEDFSDNLPSDKNPGPKNIGSLDSLDENTLQAFATEYFHAFKNDYQVHPYLN